MLTIESFRKPEGHEDNPKPGWYMVKANDGKEYEWHTYFVCTPGEPRVGDKFEPFVDPLSNEPVVKWMSVKRDSNA